MPFLAPTCISWIALNIGYTVTVLIRYVRLSKPLLSASSILGMNSNTAARRINAEIAKTRGNPAKNKKLLSARK